MSESQKPTRTWRQIAEEVSRERDPEKVYKLSVELERALDERAKRLNPQSSPDAQNKPA